MISARGQSPRGGGDVLGGAVPCGALVISLGRVEELKLSIEVGATCVTFGVMEERREARRNSG